MDEFWKNKLDILKTKIEDKDVGYIYEQGIKDLAFYYRTYFDDNLLKNIVDDIINLLANTNNSLLQLSLIYLISEINFIQITENEEYYKEKIRLILTELISKINKIKTNVDKDYPQEYRLYSTIPRAVSLYVAGNIKTMESTLIELQKSFPDNPKINLLLALSKMKTSSTIYKVNLIEVIKTSTNTIEKAISQELVGDISELLQSISWYDDSENIYLEAGLYRDLLRLYYKKVEKLKSDPTKKIQLSTEYIKLTNTLLKLGEKEIAKKYLFEAFNILLQLNSYIEILDIINKNNFIEIFPENINDFQEIITKTFEKRITIDPYNINLYIEYSNWLGRFNQKEKQQTILKNAYKICTEKKLNDKMLTIANTLLSLEPYNIEYTSMYIESMLNNNQSNEKIEEILFQKLEEFQKLSKNNEYNFIIQKFSHLIPWEKIKNMEKQKIIEEINNKTNLEEKLTTIKEYLSKYPDDHEITHVYIINKSKTKHEIKELHELILKSIDWYKNNLKHLNPSEIETIYNILLENQDFESVKRLL
ncbi:MAG: hypothetical protein NZM44_06930 [Candidatus Calescibacterium sp.]|nr:hypothetical protein [Candidatus Calescibacterium sp.]